MTQIGEVEYNGLRFRYRYDTTDWNIIQEACGGLNTKFFDVELGEYWVDIGAHIGAFTCYALKKGAIVEAYEPIPDNFHLLKENVAINSLEQNADIWNKAVTKSGGFIELFVDRQNYGNCSVYDRGNIESITVDSFSARAVGEGRPFCIKIDTEGYEYPILSELDLSKVQKLIMEDHYWLISKEEQEALMSLIEDSFPNVKRHQEYMVYAWC